MFKYAASETQTTFTPNNLRQFIYFAFIKSNKKILVLFYYSDLICLIT